MDYITAPNFFNFCYAIKKSNNHNTLTIDYKSFANIFSENKKNKKKDFYICFEHRLSREKLCSLCCQFEIFKNTFYVKKDEQVFPMPPPCTYHQKNYNFFQSFIDELTKDNNRAMSYHKKFLDDNFRIGKLRAILSGTKSFVRTSILGFRCYGARMSLTLDAKLSPHYVSIPESMYRELNMCTNYVIIKRDPSITATCLYIAELLVHDSNDPSIHGNLFFCDGLHADQDGDELTVYIFKKGEEIPSFELQAAITEMQNLSWKLGSRHDFLYNPRYNFGQHFRYILFKYSAWFQKFSPLWASLKCPTENKPDLIMNLGCSILRNEVDDFINVLLRFCHELKTPIITLDNLLNGSGDLTDIFKSKSKGTQEHLMVYLNKLHNIFEVDENEFRVAFDRKIIQSKALSLNGQRQFNLLYALNSLVLFRNTVYFNNKRLIGNFDHNPAVLSFVYNLPALNYILDILIDAEL